MNITPQKIKRIRDEVVQNYLGPLFLIFTCLTIKSDVVLHHFFSWGFVIAVGLLVVNKARMDKNITFLFSGKKMFIWLFILGLWMIVSALLSDYSHESLRSVLRSNLFFLVIYLLFISLVKEKQQRIYLYSLMLIGVVVSISIVFEFILSFRVFKDGEVVRYSGFINAPNIAGYIIAICTLLFLPKLKTHRYLVFFVLVNMGALILTSSRSAWMMFGIATGLYMINRFRFKEYKRYYIAITLLVLIIGLVFYGQIYELARFKYGITYRDYLWLGALRMFVDNPVFGVGTGNFQYFISEYIQGVDKGSDIWLILSYGFTHAHSLLLTNFSELGLPGGLIVMGLLIKLIIHFFRNRNNMNADGLILFAIFCGFLARSFFESNGFLAKGWFALDIYMWLVIIISLNLQTDTKEQGY